MQLNLLLRCELLLVLDLVCLHVKLPLEGSLVRKVNHLLLSRILSRQLLTVHVHGGGRDFRRLSWLDHAAAGEIFLGDLDNVGGVIGGKTPVRVGLLLRPQT